MSTPQGTRCVKIAVSQHEAVHIYSNAEGITLELRRESRSVARWGREPRRFEERPGRIDPCPRGSGKKYKKCCGR